LTSSFFFPNDVMTRRFAVGHMQQPDGTVFVARPWKMPRSANAGGGISSNARDQIKWARFHLGDGRSESGTHVLSTELLRRMQQPTADMVGSALGDCVGISWLLRDVDGVRLVGHGGTTIGQHSRLVIVPEREFAATVLTNCGPNGAQLHDELLRWILEAYIGVVDRDPDPIALTKDELESYAGLYETVNSLSDISVEDGQLVLSMRLKDDALAALRAKGENPPPEQPPLTLGLIAGPGDRYIVTGGPLKGMRGYFGRGPTGQIVSLHAGGRLATRVADRSRH
jgi:hypothetical protein